MPRSRASHPPASAGPRTRAGGPAPAGRSTRASGRLPAAQRRRQVAEAALRLLASRGASSLTLAELSAEVGIADASILRHLPSREAIIDAAVSLFVESLSADFPDPECMVDPAERLRAFFVSRLQRVRDRPELLSLAFNTRLEDAAGARGARRVREMVARSASFLRECIAELQGQGRLRCDLPVELFVWTIVGVVRGAALGLPDGRRRRRAEASSTPEQVLAELERLLDLRPLPPAGRLAGRGLSGPGRKGR